MGFDSSPEPEPEFSMAKEMWGKAWPVHVYIFALLFMMLSLYNINSIAGLIVTAKHIQKKAIFMFANIMLWSFNIVTSLQLFIDPYGSVAHMKLNGLYFLAFGMKIPCLSCAFSFIYIALIETSKVKLYSRKLHNIKYFVAIVVTHFVVSLGVHLYLIMSQKHFQVVIICLSFFLIFSIAISFLFLFNYCKIKRLLGGNSAHLPTVKFQSSPRQKRNVHLTLSSHVDDIPASFPSYPVNKTAVSEGIVNIGLADDEEEEEINLSDVKSIHNIAESEICTMELNNSDLPKDDNDKDNDNNDTNQTSGMCTIIPQDGKLSLGIVNYGIDNEDILENDVNKSSVTAEISDTTFSQIQDSKHLPNYDDNDDDNNDVNDDINNNDDNRIPDNLDDDCDVGGGYDDDDDDDDAAADGDDDVVVVDDYVVRVDGDTIIVGDNKDNIPQDVVNTEEEVRKTREDDVYNTTDSPERDIVVIKDIEADTMNALIHNVNDNEIYNSDKGLPEPANAQIILTEDNTHLHNSHSISHDTTIDIMPQDDEMKHRDRISRDGISCNGYIIQTYAPNDEKSTTEQPTPIIITNVLGSLKRSSEGDNGSNKPFGNVLSNFALPNGGITQQPTKETTLSIKRPAFVDKSLNKLLKLVTVVSISSFLYCAAIIYYIIILVTNNKHLQTGAWPWFIYQTVARIAEIGMSGTMSYLVRRSVIPICKD